MLKSTIVFWAFFTKHITHHHSLIELIMQPQYEKVARLFNGPDAVHPGIILLTRVDCAEKVQTSSLRSSSDEF